MAREPYPVGQIVGAFGLKGEMKVKPMTDFLERLYKGKRLRLKGEWVEVVGYRVHKNRPLLKLEGVESATSAEGLQWEYLESIEDSVPELEEDEFRTSDLIGLKVITTEGQNLGEIDDVLVLPAHDVIKVGEVLIPAIKEFVVDVDLDQGLLTVQLIEGML